MSALVCVFEYRDRERANDDAKGNGGSHSRLLSNTSVVDGPPEEERSHCNRRRQSFKLPRDHLIPFPVLEEGIEQQGREEYYPFS